MAQNGVDSGNHSPIPVFDKFEVLERLSNTHPAAGFYKAMYSSVIGGITTDPSVMVVPFDDHMVHRGHAVFDTSTIKDGYLYELEPHLDRILRSAKSTEISLPFSRSEIRRILIELVAVSGVQHGMLRFFLSAGPGGFNVTMAECLGPTFYAVVIEESDEAEEALETLKVITTTVPIKPPQFANVKSTNYLPNALVFAEANSKGAYSGVWLDQEGNIAEAPNMNLMFVTEDKVLLVPKFEKILSGCTARRLLELVPRLIESRPDLISEVKLADISVKEGRAAREMFFVGSGILVKPITHWDDQPVGTGLPGPVGKALKSLMEQDRDEAAYPHRTKVPYRN